MAESPESILSKRLVVLKELKDQFPMLGGFSPEQMLSGDGELFGNALIPPGTIGQDDDRIFGLANIRRKDITFIMKVFTKAEKQAGKKITLMRWLKTYLWLTRAIKGMGGDQYIRLGPAGLVPVERPGRLKRFGRWLRRER